MLFVYPAIFHEEDDSFWVEFPDLEGCQSFGLNINDTLAAAQEALAGYILVAIEEGMALNPPSALGDIVAPQQAFTSLVACSLDQYKDTKAVKKTLSIPAWLNDRSMALGINFSQTLQDALVAKIQTGKLGR